MIFVDFSFFFLRKLRLHAIAKYDLRKTFLIENQGQKTFIVDHILQQLIEMHVTKCRSSLWTKWNKTSGIDLIVIFFQTLSTHCQYEKKGTSNHRPRPLSKLLEEDQMLGKYDQDLIFCFLFIKLLDVPFLKILLSIWLSNLKKIRREYYSGKLDKK